MTLKKHVTLNPVLMFSLAEKVFSELVHDQIFRKLKKFQAALWVARFSLSGHESMEASSMVVMKYFKAFINWGTINIFLNDKGMLMAPNVFVDPFFRAFVSKVEVCLQYPNEILYEANVSHCLSFKRCRDFKVLPDAAPYGGVPQLNEMLSRTEFLDIDARFVAPNFSNGFPNLTAMAIHGSVDSIERFFADVGTFPSLVFLRIDVVGDIGHFLQKFPHEFFPKVLNLVVDSVHTSSTFFKDFELFPLFVDNFPLIKQSAISLLQSRTTFSDDPSFYESLHLSFLEAPCKVPLRVVVHHIPTKTISGADINYLQVGEVLEPIGYEVNDDRSALIITITGRNKILEHHIFVEIPDVSSDDDEPVIPAFDYVD